MSGLARRLQQAASAAGGFAWPDAGNTGIPVGTTLQHVPADVTSGTGWHWRSDTNSISIDSDGVVLDSLDCDGGIYNPTPDGGSQHIDITVTNCRFRLINWTAGGFGIQLGSGSTMSHCEVGGGADGMTFERSTGIESPGADGAANLIEYCDLHHLTHALHTGGYTTVNNCWLHDMDTGQNYGGDVAWQSSQSYAAGDFVVPADPGNYQRFECTTAGTSGTTEPTWPSGAGATITDGSAVWTNTPDHTECVFVDTGHYIYFNRCRMSSGNTAVFFGQNYGDTSEGTGDLYINRCKFEGGGSVTGEIPNYAVDIENKDINGTISVTNCVFDGPAYGSGYPYYVWGEGVPMQLPIGATVSGNTYTTSASADADVQYQDVVY